MKTHLSAPTLLDGTRTTGDSPTSEFQNPAADLAAKADVILFDAQARPLLARRSGCAPLTPLKLRRLVAQCVERSEQGNPPGDLLSQERAGELTLVLCRTLSSLGIGILIRIPDPQGEWLAAAGEWLPDGVGLSPKLWKKLRTPVSVGERVRSAAREFSRMLPVLAYGDEGEGHFTQVLSQIVERTSALSRLVGCSARFEPFGEWNDAESVRFARQPILDASLLFSLLFFGERRGAREICWKLRPTRAGVGIFASCEGREINPSDVKILDEWHKVAERAGCLFDYRLDGEECRIGFCPIPTEWSALGLKAPSLFEKDLREEGDEWMRY